RSAITALHRAALEKGFLQRVQLAVALEPFDRGDFFSFAVAKRCDARAGRLAVDEHSARAAASLAASILAAGEIELVAEDAQEAAFGIGLDAAFCSVDQKFGAACHDQSLSKSG